MRKNEGIYLTCDTEGKIIDINFNHINPELKKFKGRLFSEMFSGDSFNKSLDFFTGIKKYSASFGWELMLKPELADSPMSFGGAAINNSISIFGSYSIMDFNKFFDGILRLNNEQVNTIRNLEKEKSLNDFNKERRNTEFFNSISSINNELVDTQRELTKKNAELIELNKLKNQFVGMAAHDLRNPLGSIYALSTMLGEDSGGFNSEQKEFVNVIKDLSSFMLKLVTDLLDISAIESGTISLKPEIADIEDTIKSSISLNNLMAEKKKIHINFFSSLKSKTIVIDKGKITQVINNLLSNAIKFSIQNTLVDVKMADLDEDNILIKVADKGLGIKESELANLFKPFTRTSTKGTEGEPSTGLGLFIVKRIVEAHGGKIWLESLPGKGTTFFFTLHKNKKHL